MLQVFSQLMKWMSIPVLLIVSMFSYAADRYEPVLVTVAIIGALAFVGQAVRLHEYSRAVALVAVVVAFSPLFLVTKIFLVMGLICMATLVALVGAFRPQPVPVA